MRIVASGKSDPGRQRAENEDRFVVEATLGLFGVCDGMGGHAAGEVAAALALDAAIRMVKYRPWVASRVREGRAAPDTLLTLLDRAFRLANTEVALLAREHDDYRGMGCTLTVLLASGRHAALASVGDSRFYLLRHDHAQQLTMDHTVGEEIRRTGATSAEEMASSRYARMLSRAIGTKEVVHPDIFPLDLVVGDRFLACTDGLSDYIESEDWLAEELKAGTPDEVSDRLVGFANRSGGKDNITVVVGAVEP